MGREGGEGEIEWVCFSVGGQYVLSLFFCAFRGKGSSVTESWGKGGFLKR